jgi:hypothetical protein
MTKAQSHDDRHHARYAPSAAARWLACHGSVRLSDGVPDGPPSSYAQDGTACHEAAAAILEGADPDDACRELCDEQVDIVTTYTDYCIDLVDLLQGKFGRNAVRYWVEERGYADFISPDYHGTADFAIHASRTLEIVDLKTGYNPVEPKGNPQLYSYALLAISQHDLWDKVDRIRMTIIQPRVYAEPQTVVISSRELDHFQHLVVQSIKDIENGSTTLVAGAHCKYCPAKGRCPELRKEAIKRAKIAFNQDGTRKPEAYDAETLAEIAREAAVIQAHLDGVMQQIRRELEKGRKVPGFKLVEKRAMSKWSDWDGFLDASPVDKFAFYNDLFTVKPKTPNQVQAFLKKQKINFDLSPYFTRESSGLTLAPYTDPRDAKKLKPFEE